MEPGAIDLAYRLLLGRKPSQDEIANLYAQRPSLDQVRELLKCQTERGLDLAAPNAVRMRVQERRHRPFFYLGRSWGLTRLREGYPFYVNTRDRGIAPWIILFGGWETHVADVIDACVKPGMNTLDVGANLGYYTVKMGRLAGPSGGVLAFEPNPEILPFLRANIAINGLNATCQVQDCGAGAAESAQDLSFDYENMGAATLAPRGGDLQRYSVQLKTIDSCTEHLSHVDLVKMDCEGHEPLAIQGAQRLLMRSPGCAIVLEISPGWLEHGPIDGQLGALAAGRRLYLIPPNRSLVPFTLDQVNGVLTESPGGAYVLLAPDHKEMNTSLARLLKRSADRAARSEDGGR